METRTTGAWSWEEFGTAALGDERRTARVVRMAERAAEAPNGKVSAVFRDPAELQAAYDFLENPAIDHAALLRAMQAATAGRCVGHRFVFVPIDGTSLTLTDRRRAKDFGAVGSYKNRARGLKVIDALAVSPQGVPLGITTLQWWARHKRRGRSRPSCARKVKERETQHWLDGIEDICQVLEAGAPGTRAWFQLDRGGDAAPVLRHLSESGHWFTVRACFNRRLRTQPGQPRRYLRQALAGVRPIDTVSLHVTAGHNRTERQAQLQLRATTVTLDLRNSWTKACRRLPLNAVWVREKGRVPHGDKRIEWLLLTNHPIGTAKDVRLVVAGYAQRWRIEDFHRTWKSGACNVEQTQLRATAQVLKWATLLAAVAARIERLKHLARSEPDQLATVELRPVEIEALLLLKRLQKKRTDSIADEVPTIGIATRWIAELGGYMRKSSGGPPGSITIGRGLLRLQIAAHVLEGLHAMGKLR